MLARVEFDGEERARLAYAQGKGVLFITGHFGFWELHAMVHALRLEPIGVLARALDNPQLNRLLEQIRQRTGNTVIYRRGTIRRVMRTLQAGHGVAVLIDQHIMSRDAIYVDFFERPAATTSAVAALALRTGAPVVPVFALPLGGGRYRMIYEHPVEPPRADTRRRRPRVHAAVHRRARDVRAPASGAVAVDAPPLARRWTDADGIRECFRRPTTTRTLPTARVESLSRVFGDASSSRSDVARSSGMPTKTSDLNVALRLSRALGEPRGDRHPPAGAERAVGHLQSGRGLLSLELREPDQPQHAARRCRRRSRRR